MRRPALLLIAVLALVAIPAAHAQGSGPGVHPEPGPGVTVHHPVHFDISPPLRDMKPLPPSEGASLPPELKLPPWINTIAPPPTAPPGPHVLQTWPGRQAMPAPIIDFDGVGYGTPLPVPPGGNYAPNWTPPDTEGDVGTNYYVQWVNLAFAVFSKSTGAIVYGPLDGNTIWQGFGGRCESDNSGDPIVKYDHFANRWIFTQFAVGSTPYTQCIAVSTTSDPTGPYYRYAYSYSYFNDYPKLAVWPDGYYITYNMFNGNFFAGGQVCAFDRTTMLTGGDATEQCFGPYSSYGGWLPSDVDGPNLPPSGSPNYVLAFGTNSLLLWKFHVDWTTPGNSSFTGPTAISVASFSEACSSSNGTCIPQPGGVLLDSLADRVMYRLAYRNFGDHESLVVNHSVNAGGGVSGVRWYELRDPNGAHTIYQSGTYSPDSTYRWMGSIAMDHMGNMALGYSASDSSTYPSIWYAGRLVSDSLGQLPQAETIILNGTGYQASSSRWGDYSSMSIDPTDDCTFWYTQEYHAANGTTNWKTRIASFKYPDCTLCSTTAPSGLTATASGNNAIQLSWGSVSGATEYRLYRSTSTGTGYSQIATITAPAASYLDTGLQGGTTYYYVVTAYDACESVYSSEASATAEGPCDQPPTFAGISSAVPSTLSACAIDLSWSAATAHCGGPVSYSVYRSTSTGFTPSAANRIAAAFSGTSYTDASGLANGTTYYYIVRATDEANGQEDANIAEASTSASGSGMPIDESFPTGDPPAGWSIVDGGTGTQHWTTTNPGGRSTPGGMTAPFEIIDSDYDGRGRTQNDSLITPGFSSAGAISVTLEFDTYYRDYDTNDFAYIDVSSNGGSSWTNLDTWTTNHGSASAAIHETYDTTALAGSSTNVKVRFRYVATWGWYWFVDNVKVTVLGACSSTPSDPLYLTVRSVNGEDKLEWVNPQAPYSSTNICRSTSGYPDPSTCTPLTTRTGTVGAYDSWTDTGLTNNITYYYTAFVDGGTGAYSSGREAWGRPLDSSGHIKWAYHTAAASLTPPGVRPGTLGTGATYAVSNDRILHGMNTTASGGDWPRTTPFAWEPMAMNGPAGARPGVVPTTVVPGADTVTFLGAEDGHVYAADAKTGTTLWQSAQLANMLLASPSGTFTAFGGSYDQLFIGTRSATSDNAVYALDPSDGATRWSFNNGGGAGGIGIISSGAAVDVTANRLYFTSRARGGGSSNTLWCISFTDTGASLVWGVPVGDIDGAPVLYQGRLYVGTNDGHVYAINPTNGATLWTETLTTGDGPVKGFVSPEASPTLPRRLYFATTTKMWALNDNGSSASLAWSVSTIGGPSIPLAPYGASKLYVGSSDGSLYQLDAASGNVDTSLMLGDGSGAVGSPAYDTVNNIAYVGSEAGVVYAVTLPLQ